MLVVFDELPQHVRQMSTAKDQEMIEHLPPDRPHPPLGDGVGHGRPVVGQADDLHAFTSKLAVNLASRSRIRKRARIFPSWRSQASSRACWTTHAPVGETVQPARWMQRLPTSVNGHEPSAHRVVMKARRRVLVDTERMVVSTERGSMVRKAGLLCGVRPCSINWLGGW